MMRMILAQSRLKSSRHSLAWLAIILLAIKSLSSLHLSWSTAIATLVRSQVTTALPTRPYSLELLNAALRSAPHHPAAARAIAQQASFATQLTRPATTNDEKPMTNNRGSRDT